MSDGSIAIVGASCRFPGAADVESFWELLTAARDAVREVDERRWSTRFYFHPNPRESGKSYTWAAGLIEDADRFEPAFFGISPREAAQMDPQQRLLLELVWHALEDAGIPSTRLAGSETGVYIGASTTDYSDLRLGDPASGNSYSMTGNTLSILSNRISYVFDLRGPSLTVDTACSSSMVALHHACEAIRDRRIAGAIVGGVNLLLAPYPFLGFCRASMLSRRGRCFAFDARADGYVRGEGGGVIVLRPLAAALADGDPIRGVILGSGVNSDGRTIGLSLPSEVAQAALLTQVYARAGVAPDDLAFFEMHGTGTPAGDPIEAAAVGRALGERRRERLPIGSVKTNIGHLEPASGMAGLLKATLALERGVLPPTLHCETPNPNIAFDALNLRLVRAAETIEAAPDRRFAGVNSFGFGGTNAHVVLSAPPPRAPALAVAAEPLPLVLSARSEASLKQLAHSWRDTLARAPAEQAPALMRAAARRRDHHPHRLVVLGGEPEAMADALAGFADDAPGEAAVSGTALREGRLAFVYSGNGAQWVGMGREALRANAGFAAALDEVDLALHPLVGWSVAEMIATGVEAEAMARADVAQPLLFAIQVGIVRAMAERGVVAGAHIGHSVGEIAAAWAAGALSLDAACRVVVARSRQQERTRGTGRMAALALGGEATRELLAQLDSPAEVAALNTAQSVTISGPDAEIERVGAEARRRGLFFRKLDLDFAFHSCAMDAIEEDLLRDLDGLAGAVPQAQLVSTVTGEAVTDAALGAEYWWHNIRKPVRFADATARLIGDGYRIFVEIGPSAVLQSYLNDALRAAEQQGRVLPSLTRRQEAGDPFPQIAARCYVAGYDLTDAAAFDGPAEPRGLPLYPWQRERFWFEATVEATDPTNPPFDHPLLGFRQPGAVPFWLNHLDDAVVPWLADHAIEGTPVLPAAAVLEMALAAARWRWPTAASLEVLDVELRRPLPFETGRMRELRTVLGAEDGEFELASRPRLSTEPPTLHAVGRIAAGTDARHILLPVAGAAAPRHIEAEELYAIARRTGLDYGARFRTVSRVRVLGPTEAIAELDAAAVGEPAEAYLIHPALLDGALQGLVALLADRQHQLQGISFLPWRFGRVRLAAPFGRTPCTAELRLTRVGIRSASADVALFDAEGAVVAELADCWFRRIELSRRGSVDERALRIDLVPMPLAEEHAPLADLGAALTRSAAAREPDPARREQALLLDALVAAVAWRALSEIADPGTAFTVAGLVEQGAIAASSVELAEHLLRLVERFGAAAESELEWRLLGDSELPEVAEVWRLLLAEAPDLVAELALLAAAVEDLPKVLVGGPRQADAWASPMAEHLRQASPASTVGIDLLCDAVEAVAARWPEGRPLRILEVEAGSGAATRRLLLRLAQSPVAFTYLAANADPEQAARLSFLVESFVGARAQHWAPQDGGEALGDARFDMILAVNACARLQLDAEALRGLRGLLAPGGAFMAVEPEPNSLWDIVFGRSAQWWQRSAAAADASPLRFGEEWSAELSAAGFVGAGTAAAAAAPWPSALFWGNAPEPEAMAAAAAKPLSLTLVGGGEGATALASALQEAGHRVAHLASDALPEAEPRAAGDEAFLFLADMAEGVDAVAAGAGQVAALARLAVRAAERHAGLWVVTSGAQQPAPEGAAAGVVGAALWGLARVLVNEMPRLSLRLLDLPPGASPAERAEAILLELAAASPESEIVWTPAGRHVLRLRRGLPPRWAAPSDSLTLASTQPGGLDSLGWRAQAPVALAPGLVAIEVAAAGLNFRDIMWGMGLLPEEALIDGFAGPTFGLECAGIVSAVGDGVTSLAVGDRVMAFAPASLSSRVVTPADAAVVIPAETSFAAAATVPVTFVTAIYALGYLAKLQAGEHVLIHGAAGGVGLAAIQYAKNCGAVVIATAGSEVKRAFLRLAGADHVLDSRDLAFADAVREITAGQGVDVVLNSLSGEAMELSLGVLRPFGRFLELGKRDFYLNRRIHLRPLRQNVSYFAIDVDQLPVRRPDLARRLLGEVSQALAEGKIRPLAHRTFAFAELDDAFRLMQSSGHVGKLVLVPGGNAGVRLREVRKLRLRQDGTYLVTGGLDGFGYEAARWLAAHGAGTIALVGRRGAGTPGAEARVAELRAAGAAVRVCQADVADPASLGRVLAEIRAGGPPLRGVVHAASAIDDGLAAEIEAARVAPVLRPKLGGALVLDALTREDPLDLFLVFSSATSLLGAPGQGVYVAANVAAEAVARQRRAEGRPALAVGWGPIEDAGYLAARPEAREALSRRLGAKPMPAAQALSGLSAMLGSGLSTAAFAETSWTEARRFLPILATPLFADLRVKASAAPSDELLADRLASLDADERLALLKTVVSEEAATILRLPAAGFDALRPLSELGMDSLMAVELRLALESRLRINLPLVSLAEGTSVASIAARLAATISAGPKDSDLIALAARHEAGEAAQRAAAEAAEDKSVVAAE